MMKRLLWVLCLGLWGVGCTDWTKAEALLPKPPVHKLEAVVDASGEKRLVAIYPEKDTGFAVAVLDPSGVVKTLKKRFAQDTTFQGLQVLRREEARWVFFQSLDAKARGDHYWDVDKNELYSLTSPLMGGGPVVSKQLPRDSPLGKLLEERAAEEERRLNARVADCIEDSPELKDEQRKPEDALRDVARLRVDGQSVLVGVLSLEPTRIALCREEDSGEVRRVSLLTVEEKCLSYGSAERLWFEDVAPTEGSELLVNISSINCTGMKGSEKMLAVYTAPLDGPRTRQVLFAHTETSVIGIDPNNPGYSEELTDFRFTGKAGGYTAIATTRARSESGGEETTSRRRRTYVWSKAKDQFVKKGE
jgi:hypothetical protein